MNMTMEQFHREHIEDRSPQDDPLRRLCGVQDIDRLRIELGPREWGMWTSLQEPGEEPAA
jgi:hypothetical protein